MAIEWAQPSMFYGGASMSPQQLSAALRLHERRPRETVGNVAQPDFKYWAFISYSHQDKAWGDWLHRQLETYRVPRHLIGRHHWSGSIPARLIPIFRDRDELPSSADLGAVLNEALRQSRYQVVICSPRSAQSRWVNEEIKYFKSLGRENGVLALIVDGEPRVGSVRECFPPALRFKLDPDGNLTNERTELVAADARKGRDERDGALIKLIAGLLGVSFDELKQRERQRRFWRHVQRMAAGVATFAAVVGSWQWFEHYKARQALEAHVEKVYDLGRRELLDHHEERAAVYLNAAYRLGRDTPALRFLLGQAMQVVDAQTNIRVQASGNVNRTAFSRDGSRFITIAEQHYAKRDFVGEVWETATGRKLARLEPLPPGPWIIRFLPERDQVLISGNIQDGAASGTTGIWDLNTGHRVMQFDGRSGWFGQPTDDRVLLLATAGGSTDGPARVWDGRSFAQLRTFGTAPATSASVDDDGRRLVTGTRNGHALLWDVTTGKLIAQLPGATATPIVAAMFAAHGTIVVGFSQRGDVRVWDVTTHELLIAFAADPFGVYDVRMDAAGTRMVTVGKTGYKVWDLVRGGLLASREATITDGSTADLTADGNTLLIADDAKNYAELIHIPNGHTLATIELNGELVGGAALRPDGKQFLLTTTNGAGSLWNLPVRKLLEVHHSRMVYAARFDPARGEIVTAGEDGSLRSWDSANGELLRATPATGDALVDVRFTDDGRRIADIALDGTVELRDAENFKAIAKGSVRNALDYNLLTFLGEGKLLAAASGRFGESSSQSVPIWSGDDGRLLRQLEHGCDLRQIAAIARTENVVTGCADGRLRMWNARTGQLLRIFDGLAEREGSFAISPRGNRLASYGFATRFLIAWDTQDGHIIKARDENTDSGALSAAFNASGDELAVGVFSTSKIEVHHLRTGAVTTLAGHEVPTSGLRFLSNGVLVSYRADSSVRAWDVDRGELLGEIASHDAQPVEIDVDSAEDRLLTSGQDGAAIIWDIRSETRSPEEIARKLRCAARWQLVGETLQHQQAAPADCSAGAPNS